MQQGFSDDFRLVGDARVMAMIVERAIAVDEAKRDSTQVLLKDKACPEAGYPHP